MSFTENNLSAFIDLLSNQSHLFSDKDRQELLQHLETIEDNQETLSEFILKWCVNKLKIKTALQSKRRSYTTNKSDTEAAPGTNNGIRLLLKNLDLIYFLRK
jgi:hypothetical protein